MFGELKRKKLQLAISMFLHKVKKKTMSTIDNPQPLTSSVDTVEKCHESPETDDPSINFNQKINSLTQCYSIYNITPFHLIIVGTVSWSYIITATMEDGEAGET